MFESKKMGIVLSYINTILSMIFGIILSSYLIKTLGDTEYGLYQTVTAFANYLLILEIGTGTITQRNVVICYQKGDTEGIDKTISTMWIITIILSLGILIVSICLYLGLGILYQNTMTCYQIRYAKKIFSFFIGNMLLTFLTQTLNGYAFGVEKVSFAQIARLVKAVLRTITIIVITLFYKYSIVIAAVDFVISLLIFIVTFRFCKRKCAMRIRLALFDKSIIVEAFPLCVALLFQSLIQQANSSVDKVIIGSRLSIEDVAIYSVAQSIYYIFMSILIAPISMYLPQISRDMNSGVNRRKFTDTLIQPTRLIAIISGIFLFGFIAVGKQFVVLFYGSEKSQAWIYALIIIVPLFLSMTNGVILNVLDITKKRLARSIVLLGATLANVILTWFFTKSMGVVGAVTATAITMVAGEVVVLNIYYAVALKIDIHRLYWEAYRKTLPILIIAAWIAYIIGGIFSNSIHGLFVGGIAYLLCAGVFLYRFALLDNEKQELHRWIRILKNRLKKT